MKTTASVQMPLATLKAIKEVLFSKTNGIDLSNIISDLSVGEDCNNELTAINVALVYNGYIPEIEKTSRYEYCYDGIYYQYKMIKHSLILNAVVVEKSQYVVEGDVERITTYKTVTIPYDQWIKLDITKAEILEKIKKYKCNKKSCN